MVMVEARCCFTSTETAGRLISDGSPMRRPPGRQCRPAGSVLSSGRTVDGDDNDDEVELHVLGCRLTYQEQTVTSAEAWFIDVAYRRLL